jgi:hypothetical protein
MIGMEHGRVKGFRVALYTAGRNTRRHQRLLGNTMA